MDIATARISYEEHLLGWQDCYSYLRDSPCLGAAFRDCLDLAMGQVVKSNNRDILTNNMAHKVDKEMRDE